VIKAVIFDLGGVVLKNAMAVVYKKTSETFNIDIETLKNKSKSLIREWQINKISSEEFWKLVAAELKVDAKSLKDLWDKTFAENSLPNEEVIEIVKELKRNYKIALLSNTVEPHAEYNKKRRDFDLFPQVFLSNEIGMRKPNREMYEYVAKTMEVKCEECVFTDDEEVNVEGARKVGMYAILFKNAAQLKEELKKVL